VNEDLLHEEQERIKRLLADDPEPSKEKPKAKPKSNPNTDQPKLF
jgi:hypothetical protein